MELSLEDIAPEDRQRFQGAAPITLEGVAQRARGYQPSEADVRAARRRAVDDMSGTQKFMAGAGKAAVEAGRGLKQVAGDWVVNPISRAFVGSDMLTDSRADQAKADVLDAPLMSSGAGMSGYVGGNVALMAGPAGAISKLPAVVKSAQMAAKLPGMLGKAASASVAPAATGAALGAAAPISGEGQRGPNAAFGAVAGPALKGAGALVGQGVSAAAQSPVGKQALAYGQKALQAAQALPGGRALAGAVSRPSRLDSLQGPERAAVEAAVRERVPVYPSQLNKPGSALSAGRTAEQRDAFDRAVGRSFGEDTADLNTAFGSAKDRIGAMYDSVLENRTIPLGKKHLFDLERIAVYNSGRSPRFPPDPELRDAVQRAHAAAATGQPMSGRDLQQALRQYTASMKQAMRGSELRPSNPHAAEGFQKLIDSLTKAAEQTMKPEELALFRQANKQWRNMSMMEALAPRDLDGNIRPAQLAQTLARKDTNAFVYGKGDTTLSDLARYGTTYMEAPGTAPKGALARMRHTLATAGPSAAGDILAGVTLSEMQGHPEDRSLAGRAASYAMWAAAAEAARRGAGRVTNPKLTPEQLSAPQGVLRRMATTGMNPAFVRAALEGEEQ